MIPCSLAKAPAVLSPHHSSHCLSWSLCTTRVYSVLIIRLWAAVLQHTRLCSAHVVVHGNSLMIQSVLKRSLSLLSDEQMTRSSDSQYCQLISNQGMEDIPGSEPQKPVQIGEEMRAPRLSWVVLSRNFTIDSYTCELCCKAELCAGRSALWNLPLLRLRGPLISTVPLPTDQPSA